MDKDVVCSNRLQEIIGTPVKKADPNMACRKYACGGLHVTQSTHKPLLTYYA